jgi:hypothetical protein
MSLIADPQQWAEHTFASADLGRAGRAARLTYSAARIAEHPQKSFPEIFDWNELRAFYRLCDKPSATLDALQAPHRQQTRQAMREHPLVLILHDTSELDFSSHRALKGRGPIGNDRGKGFLQHNSLAVVPSPRQLLGLAHQQLRVRRHAPAKETTRARKQRERESLLWQKGIKATGRPPEGCTWVDVGDRGADDYEAMTASLASGHDFLFRITQDRLVFTTAEHDQQDYLMQFARTLSSKGEDTVQIPGRGGRRPRIATVSLAAAPVWVPAPKDTPRRKSRPILPCWVIRVWEANPPADVQEPLEWVLLCSLPTETLEEIKQRRNWYACRWLVEQYHDVEKNGCSLERRRFRKAKRMWACLAILGVVAVRVLHLRLAAQEQPQAPAAQVATREEVQVLGRKLGKKIQTVREFVHGVARLGGFLDRKGDKVPGVRTLWRGYQRLRDLLAGYRLHRRPAPRNAPHADSPAAFP